MISAGAEREEVEFVSGLSFLFVRMIFMNLYRNRFAINTLQSKHDSSAILLLFISTLSLLALLKFTADHLTLSV